MRVDDILRTLHHLVGVYDSEHESLAEQFANADVPDDDGTAFFLDCDGVLNTTRCLTCDYAGEVGQYGRWHGFMCVCV